MNKISNIDFALSYEGYLWMSNENKPRVFYPEAEIESQLFNTPSPFVAEGYLFNKKKGVSFSIKYVDGQYLIYRNEVKLSDFDSENTDTVSCLTLRMSSSEILWAKFLRYWQEKPDLECLKMNVLEVEKEVFVGFKIEKE